MKNNKLLIFSILFSILAVGLFVWSSSREDSFLYRVIFPYSQQERILSGELLLGESTSGIEFSQDIPETVKQELQKISFEYLDLSLQRNKATFIVSKETRLGSCWGGCHILWLDATHYTLIDTTYSDEDEALRGYLYHEIYHSELGTIDNECVKQLFENKLRSGMKPFWQKLEEKKIYIPRYLYDDYKNRFGNKISFPENMILF